MQTDLRMPSNQFSSSFLSCEKDIETILKKIFINSRPYSDILKRLLVINTKDCLENQSQAVLDKLEEMSLKKMIDEGYIRLNPRLTLDEHEEKKSYIVISCDNFLPNKTNSYFRDCIVSFDIICNTDDWDIGNYRIRPLKIAGYIDGILNKAKLSGIGTFNFLGCTGLLLDEHLSGYTLVYHAIHGNDDRLEPKE